MECDRRGCVGRLAAAPEEGELDIIHILETEQEALARLLLGAEAGRLPAFLKLIDPGLKFVFVSDPSGRSNTSATDAGANIQSTAGSSWIDTVHPDDKAHLSLRSDHDGNEPLQLELRLRDGNERWCWHQLRAAPVRNGDGRIVEWVGLLRDIHERKSEAEHHDLVVGELRHRLKNLIAIIQALAKYSAHRPGTEPAVDAFLKRYFGRLHALTAASDLLLAGDTKAIEARAVIRATLEPFMGDMAPRISIAGPELELSEEFGGGLALAVHELATNALKYGALSTPAGLVSLSWSASALPDGEKLEFVWKERGGPPTSPPQKEGFGSRLIKSITAREKSGSVTLDYEPDGLCCRIIVVRQTNRRRAATT